MRRFRPYTALFLLFLACNSTQTTAPKESRRTVYENAIEDAVFADSSELCHQLVAITRNNPNITWSEDGNRLLVVTWTKYPSSFPAADTITTSWGDVWVTVCSEMADSLKSERISSADFTSRAEEMLGLPPGKGYTHFAEMWVRPTDLFRPAYDPDITHPDCGLNYPDGVDTGYVDWFESNIIYSYFPPRYPWTRLGYTYDWGGRDEIGMSEFVLKKGSTAIVQVTYSNDGFYASEVAR